MSSLTNSPRPAKTHSGSKVSLSLLLLGCLAQACGGGGGGGGSGGGTGPLKPAESVAGTWAFDLKVTNSCANLRPQIVGETNRVTVEIRDVTPAGTAVNKKQYDVEIPEFSSGRIFEAQQTGDQLSITGAIGQSGGARYEEFGFALTVATNRLQGARSGTLTVQSGSCDYTDDVGATKITGSVGRFLVGANSDGTLAVFRIRGDDGRIVHGPVFRSRAAGFAAVATTPDRSRVYAVDTSNSVHALALDSIGGHPKEIGVHSVGGTPQAVTLDAGARHLYVARTKPGGLAQFSIRATTGDLQAIAAPVAGDDNVAVAMHPGGSFVFAVSRASGSVQAFARNTTNGALTPAAKTSVGSAPTAIAFDRSGTHAYVTFAERSNNVKTLVVDAIDGSLTPMQTVSAGDTPLAVLVDRAGTHAYVANVNSDNVSVFAIDPGTSMLTRQQQVATGNGPRQLTFDTRGEHLYTANFESASITCLAIDAAGALTAMNTVRGRSINGLAVVAGSAHARETSRMALIPNSLGVHVNEVAESSGSMLLVATNSNSGLPAHAVVDPKTHIAYVVDRNNRTITSYPVDDPRGSDRKEFTRPETDAELVRAVLEPTGRFLLVLDTRTRFGLTGRIFTYSIGSKGLVSYLGTSSTGRNPENLVVHPAGRYVYSVDSYGDTISLFELDSVSGRLTKKQTFTPGKTGSGQGRPIAMAFHPNGRFAYVTLEEDRQLVRFSINATNGFLQTPMRVSTVGVNSNAEPRYVAVHPSGRFAIVSFWGDSVATYRIDPTNQAPKLIRALSVSTNPSHLAMDPAGGFAYAAVSGGAVRLDFDAGGAPVGPAEALRTAAGDAWTVSILSAIE